MFPEGLGEETLNQLRVKPPARKEPSNSGAKASPDRIRLIPLPCPPLSREVALHYQARAIFFIIRAHRGQGMMNHAV